MKEPLNPVEANSHSKIAGARFIRSENWQTLAGSLTETLGHDWCADVVSSVRKGKPTESDIKATLTSLCRLAHETYNGQVRAMCHSVIETLTNYGLVRLDDKAGFLVNSENIKSIAP